MKSYKRNVGDYLKTAGRLSMLQHGAYTLLMDACYEREKFPTLEEAIDWTWATTSDEIAAVKVVLAKFFTLTEEVYVHDHICNDINNYFKISETNKRIAINREESRKQKNTNRVRTVYEPCTNRVRKEPDKFNPLSHLVALGVAESVAQDWLTLRNAKKLAVTETAIKRLQQEAAKAGTSVSQALTLCCLHGWAGFRASWEGTKKPVNGALTKEQARVAAMTSIGLGGFEYDDNDFFFETEVREVV